MGGVNDPPDARSTPHREPGDPDMNRPNLLLLCLAGTLFSTAAIAADFAYNRTPSMKVGSSVMLKGVRAGDCGNTAPSWASIKGKLPKSNLGRFSDGGAGTVRSNSCGSRVAARGVRFTATNAGTESFVIYDDKFNVTVR
jgi:hypothetical protein